MHFPFIIYYESEKHELKMINIGDSRSAVPVIFGIVT